MGEILIEAPAGASAAATQTGLLVPVILSGGSGTRLWPMSRAQYPKQLLPLHDENTLLQCTALRTEGFKCDGVRLGKPIVVSNEEYRFVIAEQLRLIGSAAESILLEPIGRNTAPAITLAALEAGLDPSEDPLMLVMPSDHVIADISAFQNALRAAIPAAQNGAIVTFGIIPDHPETGYGYIEIKADNLGTPGPIATFVEKPDAETAQRYVDSGRFVWNSGLFMTRASVWLKAIAAFRPDIAEAVQLAYAAGKRDGSFLHIPKDKFSASPSDSIDYAVMEKLPTDTSTGIPAWVVPLDCGWSDVGAWSALWEVAEKDEGGNVTRGDVLTTDTTDTLVLAQSRMVACVGVDNLVIVETPDAVMVANKNETQKVKDIVGQLQKSGRSEAVAHRKVYRPWGWYDSIDNGPRFQVKRIVVNPGATLSLQLHHHRAEHWIVVSGTARVTRGEDSFLLSENQSTYISIGQVHRLANPGKVPLEIIEVQSGSYLGEDDIVRLEDTYGRSDLPSC
ncbi:mannose-1-phosphate guanylyltransferase/mannose-6-phosphate isomerase [Derxia gummosa]|uniref:mannose-1-phosphate guanylyltransferase n=1 Tax=Derxia gummosa DSM 723 TaxID=1121388 RepID=A0A8B6XAG2_9BURK|nr:mannose-1-phosphate guanylyltransferase/mannose-6-phosphate isomerase [Derxia gummosa]